MSKDWYQDIKDLVQLWGQYAEKRPKIPPDDVVEFRRSLIQEEIQETLDAINERNLPKIADGIVDSIVVLLGAAITYGIDIRPIWNTVHIANLSKVGGAKREDGKQLKPEGWKPPDVKGILAEKQEKKT